MVRPIDQCLHFLKYGIYHMNFKGQPFLCWIYSVYDGHLIFVRKKTLSIFSADMDVCLCFVKQTSQLVCLLIQQEISSMQEHLIVINVHQCYDQVTEFELKLESQRPLSACQVQDLQIFKN